jgi:hypothetical protein
MIYFIGNSGIRLMDLMDERKFHIFQYTFNIKQFFLCFVFMTFTVRFSEII